MPKQPFSVLLILQFICCNGTIGSGPSRLLYWRFSGSKLFAVRGKSQTNVKPNAIRSGKNLQGKFITTDGTEYNTSAVQLTVVVVLLKRFDPILQTVLIFLWTHSNSSQSSYVLRLTSHQIFKCIKIQLASTMGFQCFTRCALWGWNIIFCSLDATIVCYCSTWIIFHWNSIHFLL